jgi:hypothetical protein
MFVLNAFKRHLTLCVKSVIRAMKIYIVSYLEDDLISTCSSENAF